jgi:hypothetical protein
MTKLLPIILLTGCAFTTPFVKPEIIEVQVPIAVPCFSEMPTKPEFVTNEQLLELKEGNFVYSLYADRLKRIGYERELESILIGCQQ